MVPKPIFYAGKVIRSFLRYQLTSYPFADERLHAQMRRLIELHEDRGMSGQGNLIALLRGDRRTAPK